MKTSENPMHHFYILAIAIMVLLTVLIVLCLCIARIPLNTAESVLVIIPFLNALIMGSAVPRETWTNEIFKRRTP